MLTSSGLHTGPLALGPGSEVVIALTGTSRIFISDGSRPWGAVDLSRYFGSAGSAVLDGILSGDHVVMATTQGLVWLSRLDGTYGFFSGLPSGSAALSLVESSPGNVLVGLASSSAPSPPPVYACRLSTLGCTLSNTGMSTTATGASVLDFGVAPGSGGSSTIIAGGFAGVFRSANGGASWTPSGTGLPGIPGVQRVLALNGVVYLGTSSGIYRSADLGGSWVALRNGLPSGFYSATGLDGSGQTLYAAIASLTSSVYKSTDGGSSWQPTGPGITANELNAVTVSSQGVFVATNGGVFRSTDGGARWTTFNVGLNNASVLAILPTGGQSSTRYAAASATVGTIFAGTSGNLNGIYRSTDGGFTWAPGDATLNNKIVRAIGAIGNTVVASGQTGTFRSTDGGATFLPGGAGLPFGRSIYSLVTAGGTFFAGLVGGGLYKSTNAGAIWTASGTGIPPSAVVGTLAASGSTIVAGAGASVYRSMDGGNSWTAGAPVYAADPSYIIYTLAFAGNALYAGLFGFGVPGTHGVYKSLDSGATWSSAQLGLPLNSQVYGLASVGTFLFAGAGTGLYRSTDGGASWTPFAPELNGNPILTLAAAGDTLYVGTAGRSLVTYRIPVQTRRLLPIVLDVDTGSAHYTTDAALTNRGTSDSTVTLAYTASLGSGSGTATESLPAGKQLILDDVIAYLRGKGIAIPQTGAQAGTLLLTFDGVSSADAVAVTARTGTATVAPQPVGRAGLAYSALDPGVDGVGDSLTVYGLRSNDADRSNLAVFSTSAAPVTVKVTAVSGDGDGKSVVVADALSLPPYGWNQYSGILANAGISNGFVTVERVSAAGLFGAYGVVNNNATNDGSYVLPTVKRTALDYLNVPVLVETSAFLSEVVLANSGTTQATFALTYTEALNPSAGAGGTVNVPMAAGAQTIIPNVIAYLRQHGAAIGSPGTSYAGSLHITVSGALVNDTFAGARTASQSPAGGQFGLFTPAFYPGSEALDQAFIYGLRADAMNRSNVAVLNTGASPAAGTITLQLQAFDGDAGGTPAGSAETVTLVPGEWHQINNFLKTKGVSNGWVRIARTAGTAPWIGYGVVNDGANPGERTGDGAYVPMVR